MNALFVREDLIGDRFLGVDRPASFHYVCPHYYAWFGYPVRPVPEAEEN